MSEVTGIVLEIQRACFHDGPGIRTTIYLKGCPLRCRWCHNPESWRFGMESAAADDAQGEPAEHRGREMSVGEVLEIVRRDRAFYERSGGGLTVSGGEPTMQFGFCRQLLAAARRDNLHTALDTCGYNQPAVFLELLPLVNLFLWDYKATGTAAHEYLTGVGPRTILENLDRLYRVGANIRLRCPLVPGVNDTVEHFVALGELARRYPRLEGIDLLPYHAIGRHKYERLGMTAPELDTHEPGPEEKAGWLKALSAAGCVGVRLES